LTLGKCISALADPKTRGGHIPFRDSKLTKLLADSLGGQGSALMIACISPSSTNINETFKTLRYAIQAKKIQNRPMIQLDPDEEKVLNLKSEIMGLRKENSKLKELLINDGNHKEELKKILNESEQYMKNLKNRASSPIERNRASSRSGRSNSIRAPSRASIHPRPTERSNSIKTFSRNDRNNSIKLPEIKNNTNTMSLQRRKEQVVSLPKFDTSAKTRRPTLVASQRRKSAKSAATYRVDELKRSNAPASHSIQSSTILNRSEAPASDNIQLKGTRKFQEVLVKKSSGGRKPSSMKSITGDHNQESMKPKIMYL
jgi:myosin heavy subunit